MATIKTGSTADFVNRIKAVLPIGWFPIPAATGDAPTSPILDALLQGPASMLAAVWQLLSYVLRQTRIATATGMFLDTTAIDYFGPGGLSRQLNELDQSYRARILAALFPQRVTRPAVAALVKELTGAPAQIIEPRNATDTKGYGSLANPSCGGGYGYGSNLLRYGSMNVPYQGFLIADVAASTVTTAQLESAVAAILPASCVVWVQTQTTPTTAP